MAAERIPDYLPARCSCGAGIAGTMIADSRPWYACGTIAGRPCIAQTDTAEGITVHHEPWPEAILNNVVLPTSHELDTIKSLVVAFDDAIPDG